MSYIQPIKSTQSLQLNTNQTQPEARSAPQRLVAKGFKEIYLRERQAYVHTQKAKTQD